MKDLEEISDVDSHEHQDVQVRIKADWHKVNVAADRAMKELKAEIDRCLRQGKSLCVLLLRRHCPERHLPVPPSCAIGLNVTGLSVFWGDRVECDLGCDQSPTDQQVVSPQQWMMTLLPLKVMLSCQAGHGMSTGRHSSGRL